MSRNLLTKFYYYFVNFFGRPGYYDKITKQNKTSRGSSDKELWDRPLREKEIKVLRKSKVQEHKHKEHKDEHLPAKTKESSSTRRDSTAHKTARKSNDLHSLLKGKKASEKSATTHKFSHAAKDGKKINHDKSDSRSTVLQQVQIKPQLHKVYSGDDADILEGDDEEDDTIPYSRGVYVLRSCFLLKSPTQTFLGSSRNDDESQESMKTLIWI